MKKILVMVFLLVIFMTSFTMAEIFLTQQPKDVYNYGDEIKIPVKVKALTDIAGVLEINLICSGHELTFYKNSVVLKTGEEKTFDSSVVLIRGVIGDFRGSCKIKPIFGEEYVLTNEFRLSNLLKVNYELLTANLTPGNNFVIEGDALREDGKSAQGFVELTISLNNDTKIVGVESIDNGFFEFNVSVPKNLEAGDYLLRIDAYEKDPAGQITNTGFLTSLVEVLQIPTNLEIVLEKSSVEPGEELRYKLVFHDQTGKSIPEKTGQVTIKNTNDKLVDVVEVVSDEFYSFQISSVEAPGRWKMNAESIGLKAKTEIEILEKQEIDIGILNKTLKIKNVGNVVYCNKTALVKIGNQSVGVDVCLGVGGEENYVLSAPDGIYEVSVKTDSGELLKSNVSLTGRGVDVKRGSQGSGSLAKHPLVWIFIILIIGFMGFVVYRKRHKKSFFAYLNERKRKKLARKSPMFAGVPLKKTPISKNALVEPMHRAELSLSIKGERQDVVVLCLKLKNYKDLITKESNAKETLQRITDIADKEKAITYESSANIFFIFAPGGTKTFKNELRALNVAKKAKEIIDNHNKLYKLVIDYGMSIEYGSMIIKHEHGIYNFMSLGTLMNSAKRMAELASKDFYFSEKINERIMQDAKTRKHQKDNVIVYSLEELKDKEKHKKFINQFVERLERENKDKR